MADIGWMCGGAMLAAVSLVGGMMTSAQPGTSSQPAGDAQPPAMVVGFDDLEAGALPEPWKVQATHECGPLATWEVTADPSAPSAPNVLALTKINHDSGRTFNLCWNDEIRFRDGEISLRFRANSGKEDQGGGPMWRVQDRDNYYICRANPLEDNVRLYRVVDGHRKQIASAHISITSGQWHTITIEQDGEHISCSFDGERLLTATDATFPDAGGVGFWTKADAATSFDDLKIEHADD